MIEALKFKFKNRYLNFIILAYAVSRIIVYLLGVRPDFNIFFGGGPPNGIDLSLLKNNLWESVIYQHGQPPLFNFFNGLIIKIFPGSFTYVFWLFFLFIGCIQNILLYKILLQLNTGIKTAFAITLFFMLSPGNILYENWYNYTHLETFFIILFCLLLIKALKNDRLKDYFYFFLALSTLILVRNMFHLVWFAGIFLGLLIWRKHSARKIMLAAIFPLLIAGSWFIKNYFMFGIFASSSWMGIGMANITQPTETVAKIGQWKPASAYYEYIKPSNAFPEVEILHKEFTDNGDPSFYHIDYLTVSQEFMRVGFNSIKREPLKYCQNVFKALEIYFSPVTNYWLLDENHEKIKYYAIVYNLRVINILETKLFGKKIFSLPLFVFVIYASIICISFLVVVKNPKTLQSAIIIFCLFNIFYVTAVSNLIELGESNRYRYTIIPCLLILSGIILGQYKRYIKSFASKFRLRLY